MGTESENNSARTSKAKAAATYSGRFLVRMPSDLHEQLARAAEREDLSLNRFVTRALAASVTLEPDTAPPAVEYAASTTPEDRRQPSRERRALPPSGGTLRLALAANLIVVVLAGCVAMILLVLALQRGI